MGSRCILPFISCSLFVSYDVTSTSYMGIGGMGIPFGSGSVHPQDFVHARQR